MTFSQRMHGLVKAVAVVMALALPAVIIVSSADARVGGGFSSGSRGSRTFSAPPSTQTAPGTAQPFNRTFSQPGSPAAGARTGGGFFNRPGTGLLGGLAAGFLGAGLFGMLFGGGLFSGLGGFSSILGLLLQIGLIVLVIRLAMSWWHRRQMSEPAYAGAERHGRRHAVEFRRHGLWPRIGQRAAADPARRLREPSSGCWSTSRRPIRTRTWTSCVRW